MNDDVQPLVLDRVVRKNKSIAGGTLVAASNASVKQRRGGRSFPCFKLAGISPEEFNVSQGERSSGPCDIDDDSVDPLVIVGAVFECCNPADKKGLFIGCDGTTVAGEGPGVNPSYTELL